MFAVLICTGNCIAQNMLTDPQLQTQLQLMFTPLMVLNEALTVVFVNLPEIEGGQGRWMQLTAGLIGLKTSFFSSGFLGALSWRCDGEPSDLDDAACAKTRKKHRTEQIKQGTKICFLTSLWSGEER